MSGKGHPHVVFHRSAVKNSQESDKKGAQKKRKKKKKRRHSNCGTKEPRKPAETKIEWQPQGKVNIFLRRTLEKIFLFVLVMQKKEQMFMENVQKDGKKTMLQKQWDNILRKIGNL